MNAWRCDRCGAVSNAGDSEYPPENWQRKLMPVRGSTGARSNRDVVICADCDDSLYDWFVNAEESAGGSG